MTSIDVLPMPVSATGPTPGAPGSAGQAASAPVTDPAPPGTEPETAADAFAALLAAIVAAAVPQATPGSPQTVEVASEAVPVVPTATGVPVPVEPSVVIGAAPPATVGTAPVEAVATDGPDALPEVPDLDAPAPTPAPAPQFDVESPSAAEPQPVSQVTPQPVEERPGRQDATSLEQVPVAADEGAVSPPPSVAGAVVEAARPEASPVTTDPHATASTGGVAPATVPPMEAAEAAPAPAPAPAPHPPARQVIAHVSPLLEGPEGTYELTVRLHPEELGGVAIDVRLAGGEVSLSMRAETQIGHTTLRDSLPALRAELEAAGVTAGSLDLASWTGDQAGTPQDAPGRRTAPSDLTFGGDVPLAQPDPATTDADDNAVDVRM